MSEELRSQLNAEQYETAVTLEGPLLIIAGAGSGKTRTITFRMAHMLDSGIHQSQILALTFTNKAAKEMAERVKSLTGKKLSNLTVSTFHSFGVKVLKESISHLGFRENFSIYDQTDQISLIKDVGRELKIPADGFDPYMLSNLFSGIKTNRIKWDGTNDMWRPAYIEYLNHLKVYNAVDFDDLIVLPVKLFKEYPDVLEGYRERYKYIMVDEFQDTSLYQYEFMKLLADAHHNICVVGDDDQSIYSWRGANYQNIINFEKDFPELKEIKLEQNYRSTQNILNAANQLISNNTNRKEKALWSGMDSGKAIQIYYPEDETREGLFIAETLRTWVVNEGRKYHDVGVLVRTNSLTAPIEEAFLDLNIPYKVSGGTSFFQRKEIKDVIAYLRVIVNPDDDVNLLRIINTPRRGIGIKTVQTIRNVADERGFSLYSAISALRWAEDSPLSDRLKGCLADFLSLMEMYRTRFDQERKKGDVLRSFIDAIDFWGYLLQEHHTNDKVAKWKFQNILRFCDFFDRWESNPDNLSPKLGTYLNKITLMNQSEEGEEEGQVNLMTIHSAKGLEFDLVFLAGVEEQILPHARALEENPDNIQEERRLFYVAITRAREKLFMTCCRTRRIMREVMETGPSKFLEEIPAELVEFHEPDNNMDDELAEDLFAKMKAQFK
ncbi:MAG: UvrD-helicase domain-containing protein [Spirochaetales bacterium]|nr:UvrD-helicase domain-containing protein [Spirochaetales bacterium]